MRTRFAPSPTGYMHIGNLRTALYEYLIAKSAGGKFILRIEDTDQDRYVEGAMDAVFETLKLTGIKYDEGPYVGGDYGPYIQSQRKDIYKKYAKILVDKGQAYYCFCSKERLDSVRQSNEHLGAAFNYDRFCLNLTKEEIDSKLENNESYIIRQKMPREGQTTFTDLVYGDIRVDNSTLDDQVLLKSDGLPTYNFANVVDDHLMKITHVVRGNEYLSSTPKYNKLYEAFGWQIPIYVHLPPVMKDSKTKLSKRHGDASFQDLMDKGYLPEAILNYIALLGWSPRDNKEIFSLKELEEAFYIEGLSKSPAIFDIEKLSWMNGEYIKAMNFKDFYDLTIEDIKDATDNLLDDNQIEKIGKSIQTRLIVLTEINDLVSFYARLPDYDTDLFVHKKMKTDKEISRTNLKEARKALEGLKDFASANIFNLIKDLTSKLECKNSQILWPLRTALSGLPSSPGGASELAEILGKEESLRRIDYAIEKLGG